jgi:membrane peptidoglycan carboxypeptidase
VASLARSLGVRESDLDPVPSLALGTSDVTLLEMATAYATLAAEGLYREPVPVTRVETRDGRVLAEFGASSERALPRDVAQTVVHMMRGVIDRGTGVRIRNQFGVSADVAGKTGTTQNGADGWFLLMHPNLVAGAWVGFEAPAVSFRSDWWGQGSHNALLVVGDFFREAESRLPDDTFPTPFRYREPGAIYARADRWDGDSWTDSLAVDSTYLESDTFYTGEFEGYDPDEFELGEDSLDLDSELDVDEELALDEDGEEDEVEGIEAEGAQADAGEAADGESEEAQTAVQRLYERMDEEAPPEVGQGAPDPEVVPDSTSR